MKQYIVPMFANTDILKKRKVYLADEVDAEIAELVDMLKKIKNRGNIHLSLSEKDIQEIQALLDKHRG